MCGIFGYIGTKEALPHIIEGLKKLEYRGYDSAGVAILKNNKIIAAKREGKIKNLEKLLQKQELEGCIGIGHTRWATHGRPSDENSHPHGDCKDELYVVHNGIIENYLDLRRKLAADGHGFKSTTDSEVLAHLIESHLNGNLEEAVRSALQKVEGSYAIAVICSQYPDQIVVAKKASPLIIGLGKDENFVSSDIPALLKYTSKVIYLKDGEVATIKQKKWHICTLHGKPVKRKPAFISWDPESAEKGGYAHFMLKEIHEQPRAIRDTLQGRVWLDKAQIHFDEMKLTPKQLKSFDRVVFTACGTSWHAGLIGEYLFEQIAKIPTEVEYAAEFRYRSPVLNKKTLVIAITQSGETADTLAAVGEAKARGATVLSICNVVGSSIARESDATVYTYAGPEIGVASTKAFTTQVTVIYLLALLFGQLRNMVSSVEIKKRIAELLEVPQKMESLLEREKDVEDVASRYYQSNNALYLGRGKGFPIALEGALKLKEVSYIHAEGYPAAEMKHGPIALIDKNMPVIVLALQGRRYDKILGNVEEVKARGGIVIAVANEGDDDIWEKADEVFDIPRTSEAASCLLAVVPLQLFAYYIAVKRGCHVDQPRNLAKSVTVE